MWSKYEEAADDILRQVVCDCGNYRHHGVQWMPEGSGEGLSVAVQIMQKLVEEETQMLAKNETYGGVICESRGHLYGSTDNCLFCKTPKVKQENDPVTLSPKPDKNTPSSLKKLRWAIYEAVDNCHARTSSDELNMKIEELFKEYTNS